MAKMENGFDTVAPPNKHFAREHLKAVLEWYSLHVGNCRKNSSEGDISRSELDRDGGSRARAALLSLTDRL